MNTNQTIKLLIVDDSMFFCRFLSGELPKINSRIQVVGYSMNAYDAFRKVETLKPDVISLDIEMPGMNGIDFLKKLLPKTPVPVILVSSSNVHVFDVLSCGAVDFVKKPDMSEQGSTNNFIRNLSSKIMIASTASVKVPAAERPVSPAPRSEETEHAAAPKIRLPKLTVGQVQLQHPSSLKLKNTIIAIGASTGGTEATLEVLKDLPRETPGIVVTQHMPEGFTKMYAERLDRLCHMEVREAKNGDVVQQGLVLIAPGGNTHMRVVKKGISYVVTCTPGEKVNGHRPSVDVLFSSVADCAGGNAVGIILTGMGADGAKGLLEMKENGAYTIGQDKESCVVYGMPMEAYRIGGVCKQGSCSQIPSLLIQHLNTLGA